MYTSTILHISHLTRHTSFMIRVDYGITGQDNMLAPLPHG
jgi:hypothetical protein